MNTDGIIFSEVTDCSDEEYSASDGDHRCSSVIASVTQSTVAGYRAGLNLGISGNSLLKVISRLGVRFLLRSSILMTLLGSGDGVRFYRNLCMKLCGNLCALIEVADGMHERGIGNRSDFVVGKYLNETASGFDLEQLICSDNNKEEIKKLAKSFKRKAKSLAAEARGSGYNESLSDMKKVFFAVSRSDSTVEREDMCNNGGEYCRSIRNYVRFDPEIHNSTNSTTNLTTSATTLLPFTTDVSTDNATLLPSTTDYDYNDTSTVTSTPREVFSTSFYDIDQSGEDSSILMVILLSALFLMMGIAFAVVTVIKRVRRRQRGYSSATVGASDIADDIVYIAYPMGPELSVVPEVSASSDVPASSELPASSDLPLCAELPVTEL